MNQRNRTRKQYARRKDTRDIQIHNLLQPKFKESDSDTITTLIRYCEDDFPTIKRSLQTKSDN